MTRWMMVGFLVTVSSAGAAVSGNGAEASWQVAPPPRQRGPQSSVVSVCSIHAGKDRVQGTFRATGVVAS